MNFERGQVWENPDGMLMMVVVVQYKGADTIVHYMTEGGNKGMFYTTDKEIVDNIELFTP